MPLPMMVPTTMALAWLTPRSRESVGACALLLADWAIRHVAVRTKQQTETISDGERDDAADQHVPGEWNRARQREHRKRHAGRALQPVECRAALPDVNISSEPNRHSDHA